MKAIVSNKYGSPDVLELKEVEKTIPEDDQVLVKFHTASLNYGNVVLLKEKPFFARFAFGLLRIKFPIPGGNIAGTIEAVGRDIKKMKAGDEVFGELSGWGGVVLPNM